MMLFEKKKVGGPFFDGSVPKFSSYTFSGGEHHMVLLTDEFRDEETRGVAGGSAEFAFYVVGPVLFLAYRFGREPRWFDLPYSWHLVPEQERGPLPVIEASHDECAVLQVFLVYQKENVLLTKRKLVMAHPFTVVLYRAIAEQAHGAFTRAFYDETIRTMDANWPDRERRVLSLVRAFSQGHKCVSA